MSESLHGSGPVLAACSGREEGPAVLRTAALLARRLGGDTELVVVFEPRVPLPILPGEGEGARVDDPWQRHEAHRLVERVRVERARIAREYPEAAGWHIHLEVGDPPTKIARTARHAGAAVVVVGAGRRGDFTAGQVARRLMYLADTPILAIPSQLQPLLDRAVVDVGISSAGIRAARAAMRLLPPRGELHLVSVAPVTGRALQGSGDDGSAQVLADPDSFFRRIGVRDDLEVRTARLEGDPASQLLSYAEQMGIHLVVSGVEGRSPTERTLLRNLGPALLRERSVSVLLVPPVPRAAGERDDDANVAADRYAVTP